jgi:hypothetical protein
MKFAYKKKENLVKEIGEFLFKVREERECDK